MMTIGGYDVFDWTEIEAGVDENSSILLGNGFSIRLLNGTFSYSQIATQINQNSYLCGPNISSLLNAQNSNFESVMYNLENAKPIVDAYGGIGQNCNTDSQQLRRDLIAGITSLHPQLPLNPPIQLNNYLKCGNFLKRFRNVFTTNYDTLLYWTIMKGRAATKFDDGFRRDLKSKLLYWRESEKQNLFYLHGALHLFVRNYNWLDDTTNLASVLSAPIIKLEMDPQDTILPQVIQHIRNGNYPLAVTEGNFQQKINKIVTNNYLRHALQKFCKLKSDVLVSYGWSGSSNEDQHLCDALLESSVQYWFFGIYAPAAKELTRLDRQVGAINALRQRNRKKPIELIFYDTASLDPWR